MKIIRVFLRRTSATPDDDMVRIAKPPGLFDTADEVHISVAWTYDLPLAERLAELWKWVAPVKIGGPATGEKGESFTPGKYLKKGYVITSRGCPNRCWFCSVWKREGQEIRELPITEGFNLLDDNILACSDNHIRSVFRMLSEGKKLYHRPVELTGGLEAARLRQWHVDALRELKPKQLFFAYDTPDDLEPLHAAGKMLLASGFTQSSHTLRCYVLCGYPGDSFDAAEKRMRQTLSAGFYPMAMLFRDRSGNRNLEWARWQKTWARPAIISTKVLQPNTSC